MEDEKTLKELIIEQLSINYDADKDKFIDGFINDYIQIASDKSNRKKDDKKLIPYVKNAVVQAYNRLGDEGYASSTEGSQSYTFIDIEEKLAKDVRDIRLLP